jgi:hypothetical protein
VTFSCVLPLARWFSQPENTSAVSLLPVHLTSSLGTAGLLATAVFSRVIAYVSGTVLKIGRDVDMTAWYKVCPHKYRDEKKHCQLAIFCKRLCRFLDRMVPARLSGGQRRSALTPRFIHFCKCIIPILIRTQFRNGLNIISDGCPFNLSRTVPPPQNWARCIVAVEWAGRFCDRPNLVHVLTFPAPVSMKICHTPLKSLASD